MRFIKNIFKAIIRLIEFSTGTTINIRRKNRTKIIAHKDAVSDGTTMQLYVDLVEKFCTFKPTNIFEIGANYAQDAEFLRKSFELAESDIYVFEPHPKIFSEIKKMYNFNCFDLAVSNVEGKTVFHAIDVAKNEYGNSGISSLKNGLTKNKDNFFDIEVQMTRMDSFIEINSIKMIDFLKVDVEGMNYEVLEGFGNKLSLVKAIQTEGEYLQYWEGQKLYKDMQDLLVEKGFKLVSFVLSWDGIQSDSFWVQEQFLKRPN